MTVFTLCNTVLLRCLWTGNTVRDPRALKILVKAMVLTSPIRLYSFNFGIQKTLNMSLESIKNLLNIRLVFKKINPAES
jgi:hypothetical protein